MNIVSEESSLTPAYISLFTPISFFLRKYSLFSKSIPCSPNGIFSFSLFITIDIKNKEYHRNTFINIFHILLN